MDSKRVHYLQHASFEGMSCLRGWFEKNNYQISGTQLYREQSLPSIDNFDWLIILGGPMGVHDTQEYPWLVDEKKLIRQSIDAGKIVLGICLGGQLIANVLGAKVQKNQYKEIGWFPLIRNDAIEKTILQGIFPQETIMFHWHGDTFSIPDGAIPIGSSSACNAQGFLYGNTVLGLQCHPETTPQFIEHLANACAKELDESSPFIQSHEQLFASEETYTSINRIMNNLLDALSRQHMR